MWNCGASRFCPATSPAPSATCTRMAPSTSPVNHHRARVRSDTSRWAPSAHRPASALPSTTTHAHAAWTSWSDSWLGGRLLHGSNRLGLGLGLGRHVHQVGDLLLGESGHGAELAGQVDGVLL